MHIALAIATSYSAARARRRLTSRLTMLALLTTALLMLQMAMTLVSAMDRQALEEQLGRNIHAMELVQVQPISREEMQRVRVLCWVNTYHASHKSRVEVIKRTWGRKCDKILFMSDQEDPTIPTVRITAPPLHSMLWQKHREIVRLLVREIEEGDYDWVFKCDDDTFLIVENLKKYLLSPEVQARNMSEPIILGHRMTLQWWEMQRPMNPLNSRDPEHVAAMKIVMDATTPNGGLLYTPGGGGYAVNWPYLKKLHAILDEPHCLPGEIIPDDWAISFCMWFHNVAPPDTRDEQQRERFHQYNPVDLYFRPYDEEAYDHNLFESIYEENNWYSDHAGIGWKNGKDCCAPDTITFHYVKPPLMDLFYKYYYGAEERD